MGKPSFAVAVAKSQELRSLLDEANAAYAKARRETGALFDALKAAHDAVVAEPTEANAKAYVAAKRAMPDRPYEVEFAAKTRCAKVANDLSNSNAEVLDALDVGLRAEDP